MKFVNKKQNPQARDKKEKQKSAMAITKVSIIHHIAVLLLLLWVLNAFNYGHPVFYFISLVYLYQVHQRYIMRLTRKLQFEERRSTNQRRVLSDSETVRWLNHSIEKIWPLCLEEIFSQKIFLPIIPWFLDKYKPWTVKRAAIQHLYLGRNPPMFTEMRVLHESSDDDHLVLELGMSFLTADDMSAILAAKLRKRVGFGIVAKMHLTSMHVEGRVLVGVKFISKWPYIGRLRICFAEPPYFQMTVKPIFNHGVDVTELPGVAGWLDNLLAVAFEQTLVEPNMLVVDMEKFVSPHSENWFSVFVKEPVAYARVEVIEASDMKPSDLNGLADPYVKGQLGPYRFKTRIQKKTLEPKWQEEFKIPLCSWESDKVLAIEVRDKDPFVDDGLGVCCVDISNLRDGQRHDMWVNLENVKMGRLHLAITVVEANPKVTDPKSKDKKSHADDKSGPLQSEMAEKGPSSSRRSKQTQKFADTFEAIEIEGQKETGIWVHHPGSDVPHIWEPRKGRSRHQSDIEIEREDDFAGSSPKSSSRGSQHNDSGSDEHTEGNQTPSKPNILKKGLRKINTALHRTQKKEDRDSPNTVREPVRSPHANVKAIDAYRIGIKLVVEDSLSKPLDPRDAKTDGAGSCQEESGPESARSQVKDMAKNILKQAGKSARQLKYALSRKGSRRFRRPIEERAEEKGTDYGDSESSDEDSQSSSLYDPSGEGISVDTKSVSCRDQIPVGARDPVAAVSYFATPGLDNDDTSPNGHNGEAMEKNALHPKQESVFQEAR